MRHAVNRMTCSTTTSILTSGLFKMVCAYDRSTINNHANTDQGEMKNLGRRIALIYNNRGSKSTNSMTVSAFKPLNT